MGYKYNNICFETQAEALQYVSDSCSVVLGGTTNASWVAYCKVNGSSINFLYGLLSTSGTNTSPFVYTPIFPACTFEASKVFSNADVVQLSWLVVGVWVVAWGIRKLIDIFKTQ